MKKRNLLGGNVREIWKDIRGYEGSYQASNLGRIRSLDRLINYKNGKKVFYKGIILTPEINNGGYFEIQLSTNTKYKHYKVHRLIAETFISNPNNLPIINHKDHNKLNNNINNLEWCTRKYNNNYEPKKTKFPKSVKINQYDKNMNFIKTYNSLAEVSKEFNVSITSIRYCCLGKNKTCKGYIWKYLKEVE